MKEIELSQTDKNRIKIDIKVMTIVALVFTLALISLIFIPSLVLFLFKKPAEGFVKRGLIIIAALSLPLLGVSWKNIVKYVDLLKGKKIVFITSEYEIAKEKKGFILDIKSPMKLNFDLCDKLPELVKLGEPINIEVTKLSKTLL